VASGVGSPSSRGRGVAVLWAVVRCREQREKRDQRKERAERRRERKFFGEMRGERNFWNKKTLVPVGSDKKILIF
jgi:hypothetical protein